MADSTLLGLPTANYFDGNEWLEAAVTGLNEKGLVSALNAGLLIYQNADRTLTSATTVQKLFDQSTNGALTLANTGLYELEALLQLTTMSATSGNGAFSLAGTAVLAGQLMQSIGLDSTTQTTAAAMGGASVVGASAFTTNTVPASTGTAVSMLIRGMFKVTTAGTIIPSIALTTANAAVLKAGSFFRVKQVAQAGVFTVGNWS